MPSQAMQDAIETLRERQRASGGQVPPALAELRAGLPPLLIQVGTADLLLSDAERLATAATQAGVDVTLQVGQGLPQAAQATEQIGTFLRTRVR